MIADPDDLIRQRAHRIWEEEGRPDGQADAHWQRAAAEIEAEQAPSVPPAKRLAGRKPKAPEAAAGEPAAPVKRAPARKAKAQAEASDAAPAAKAPAKPRKASKGKTAGA